jgi:hypothetical protein
MKKSLLYVYIAQNDNRFTYAFTMELAKMLHLEVKTYTAIDCSHIEEISGKDKNEIISNEKRKIFTHLLALHGYYQVFYNQWSPEGNPVSKNIIEYGAFDDCLLNTIKNENVACVIIDAISRNGIYKKFEKKFEVEESIKDIPFMVLPEKITYCPNERTREISTEPDRDAFIDRVIGDSDLFTFYRQQELSNS